MIMNRDIQPVIVHVERFYSLQKDKKIIDELMTYPIYIQVNAESLLPNLGKGREMLRKKLGQDYLDDMDQLGTELLGLA